MITSLTNTNFCCIMGSLKSGKITIIETSFKKSKIWNKNCKILVKKTKSSTKWAHPGIKITTLPTWCTRTLVPVRPRLYCVTVAVWRVVAPAPSGEAPLAEGDKTGPTQPGHQYIGAALTNSPIEYCTLCQHFTYSVIFLNFTLYICRN